MSNSALLSEHPVMAINVMDTMVTSARHEVVTATAVMTACEWMATMECVDVMASGERGAAGQQNHGECGDADTACGRSAAAADEHDDGQEHLRRVAHARHP